MIIKNITIIENIDFFTENWNKSKETDLLEEKPFIWLKEIIAYVNVVIDINE